MRSLLRSILIDFLDRNLEIELWVEALSHSLDFRVKVKALLSFGDGDLKFFQADRNCSGLAQKPCYLLTIYYSP